MSRGRIGTSETVSRWLLHLRGERTVSLAVWAAAAYGRPEVGPHAARPGMGYYS